MLDALYDLRVAVLLILTFIYALFDIYNKRNVPDKFAYFSVILGLLLTFAYNNMSIIIYSLLLALSIGGISYVLYKQGQLGAGDGFEFVSISLLLPLQPDAILSTVNQFALPFILSVFVATGILAIWVVFGYYLLMGNNSHKKAKATREGTYMGIGIIVAYAILAMFMNAYLNLTWEGALIILLIAVPSSIIAVYSKAINERMVCMVYPKELDAGDIIATNLMNRKDLAFFIKKSKKFNRLADNKLIREIKNIRKKIPVYKRAMPLAAVVFAGVVVSLLFGNLILFVVSNL